MSVSKFGLSIAIILLLIGCRYSVYEQPSDKYPFKSQMVKLLESDIEIIDSLHKAEVQISYFELPKNSNKIESVVNLLKQDGWVLKGKGQGVDTYCLGLNNRVNIVVPVFGGLYDFKGGKLSRTDYSVNAVLYSYDKWGDDLCE
ncbi:hypothetical protein KTJ32_19495 [Acinetobacter gyllenbergii]|uniref:hypothetical protein n=1 Tax=Acinetobacter gyllenbergii TaxID=134534 RepID=UPI0021CE095A|nr:hypothetical protein [Acinetobacter gyllenbergii]MCU4583181.1 hypothetical protein [Acinetobacter gyllenbergii]